VIDQRMPQPVIVPSEYVRARHAQRWIRGDRYRHVVRIGLVNAVGDLAAHLVVVDLVDAIDLGIAGGWRRYSSVGAGNNKRDEKQCEMRFVQDCFS
jgi:hypothetical protein